jgi:hypothetical protein
MIREKENLICHVKLHADTRNVRARAFLVVCLVAEVGAGNGSVYSDET